MSIQGAGRNSVPVPSGYGSTFPTIVVLRTRQAAASNAMIALTFALATALAGVAGMLLANVFFVTPADGGNYMLKAYIAATIGGWGRIGGAVFGALLIALFEVIFAALPLIFPALSGQVAWLFSQTSATIVLYVALLVILFFRPQGLFGEIAQRRA